LLVNRLGGYTSKSDNFQFSELPLASHYSQYCLVFVRSSSRMRRGEKLGAGMDGATKNVTPKPKKKLINNNQALYPKITDSL